MVFGGEEDAGLEADLDGESAPYVEIGEHGDIDVVEREVTVVIDVEGGGTPSLCLLALGTLVGVDDTGGETETAGELVAELQSSGHAEAAVGVGLDKVGGVVVGLDGVHAAVTVVGEHRGVETYSRGNGERVDGGLRHECRCGHEACGECCQFLHSVVFFRRVL